MFGRLPLFTRVFGVCKDFRDFAHATAEKTTIRRQKVLPMIAVGMPQAGAFSMQYLRALHVDIDTNINLVSFYVCVKVISR